MFLHPARSSECLGANGASVRLIPGMCAQMDFEIGTNGEGLLTDVTVVGFI